MSTEATKTYTPRPGSVAERAVHLLRKLPPGTEITTAALAEQINLPDCSALNSSLAGAVTAGLVAARKKGGHARSPVFWSLSSSAPRAPVAAPAGARDDDADDDADDGKPRRRVVPAADAPPLKIVPPSLWRAPVHSATSEASSLADGIQTPDGAAAIPPAKAGRQTPQNGANRDASTGQSHGAEGSESPPGRGENVTPVLGAAPAFTPAPFRCALFNDGELRIEWRGQVIDLEREQTEQLVRFLDRLAPEVAA